MQTRSSQYFAPMWGQSKDNYITDFSTNNQNLAKMLEHYARFSCSYANTVMAQYSTLRHHSHHSNDNFVCLHGHLVDKQF